MFFRKLISTRIYLLAFSLALVVPIIAFGALSFLYYASVERGRLERQAAQIARQTGAILDSEVGDLVAVLKALGHHHLCCGAISRIFTHGRAVWSRGTMRSSFCGPSATATVEYAMFPYGRDLPARSRSRKRTRKHMTQANRASRTFIPVRSPQNRALLSRCDRCR